jgi:2-dehydrotetronate isomerase
MRISANLGFLFREHPLPDAIRAAHRQGFDAVECHWPYEHDPAAVSAALNETGLRMIGLNTLRGDHQVGENGLAAVPGREDEARAHIDAALDYAAAIDCARVHVMAGRAEGSEAFSCFVANLRDGAKRAAASGMTLLIEPLNTRDAPGYFLRDLSAARAVIDAVASPAVKVMFDCYHLQIMGGDLLERFRESLHQVGHVQFAAVPDRGEPDRGEIAYDRLLPALAELGYDGCFGAEYKPISGSFRWLDAIRHSARSGTA